MMPLEQKLALAKNSQTSSEILAELAQDKNVVVRTKVAENSNTPASTLSQLAQDQDIVVCYRVAENINTPILTLELLVETKVASSIKAVRTCAQVFQDEIQQIQDPFISFERLLVYSKSPFHTLRSAVAENTKSLVLLEALAKDDVWCVRKTVAQNLNTPTELLAELAQDLSDDVCQAAIEASLKTLAGVRRVLAAEPLEVCVRSIEPQDVAVGFKVALELDYLALETVHVWANHALQRLEDPDIWISQLVHAKDLKQVRNLLDKFGYFNPRLETEFYIGLRCITWLGTSRLREQLSTMATLWKIKSVLVDTRESYAAFDELYGQVYREIDALSSRWECCVDPDHAKYLLQVNDVESYVSCSEEFIAAQSLCLRLCERAKALLAAQL